MLRNYEEKIVSQETISRLISEENVEEIKTLFASHPDSFFTRGVRDENAIFVARVTQNKKLIFLLNTLGQSYLEEKIRNSEWDQVVTYYLSLGRYRVSFEEYEDAIAMLQNAVFYLEKKKSMADNKVSVKQEKLEVRKVLADYYIRYLESLMPEEAIELEELQHIIYLMQQLIAVLIKIAFQT